MARFEDIAKTEMPAAEPRPVPQEQPASPVSAPQYVYAEPPQPFGFEVLQQNLQNSLAVVDREVMKSYVPTLRDCPVVPLDDTALMELDHVQFFRITELVYQEDEFSVYKLATMFHTLSNKPCTLVLLIRSDGSTNEFYLGVRSRDRRYSTGTMRQMLEQSLLGMFPGSTTAECLNETVQTDLNMLDIGCVSSVTCIADYKQTEDTPENRQFVQGLEKFIYSMQGKAYTVVCIANDLTPNDLAATRQEYERIYTLLSPFANMQYNYTANTSSGTTDSTSEGSTRTLTKGINKGVSVSAAQSDGRAEGTNEADTDTHTTSENESQAEGKSHTTGISDGTNESTTTTTTAGIYGGRSKNAGVSLGPLSFGTGINYGVSASVSRGKTKGTSHTDSVSDTVSNTLTHGFGTSYAAGHTVGRSRSDTHTDTFTLGTQSGESESVSDSANTAVTRALSESFGRSQAVTLNMQNKSLLDMLQRLDKQLQRIDECESVGMWDFAAYFLGESAAEAETAASLYRALVSGGESGLETSAVNTWTEDTAISELEKYLKNFVHPTFLCSFPEDKLQRPMLVDATALASTNELAIQLGLPRKSVKGLPVMEHAMFAQEVVRHAAPSKKDIYLGKVHHLGKDTNTEVRLDLQSLAMHTFVTGSTGTGKSNTVYHMLSELLDHHIQFLVVEPAKGEYKDAFGGRKGVSVYGVNPKKAPLLCINPFAFPVEEISVQEHLDRLVDIFNACWPMYAAMPAILKDACERAYIAAGWDMAESVNRSDPGLFPSFADVLEQIRIVVAQSDYSSDNKGDYTGALVTRVRSLTTGIYGQVFSNDVSKVIPGKRLFDENVIIDLSRVGASETKALIMGMLVMQLQEYRMANKASSNSDLRHVTVLEEAHNLLKRTPTDQSSESANLAGKSVEMLGNAIAEMRTYGEGFIIADQAPGLMDMAVIRNTNTKIILRLPDQADRELVGKAAGMSDEQIKELAKLPMGVAAVYQNNWLEPVLCKVEHFTANKPFDFSAVSSARLPLRAANAALLQKDALALTLHGMTPEFAGDFRRDVLRSSWSAATKAFLLAKLQDRKAAVDPELYAAVLMEITDARPVIAVMPKILGRQPAAKDVTAYLERSLDLTAVRENDHMLVFHQLLWNAVSRRLLPPSYAEIFCQERSVDVHAGKLS